MITYVPPCSLRLFFIMLPQMLAKKVNFFTLKYLFSYLLTAFFFLSFPASYAGQAIENSTTYAPTTYTLTTGTNSPIAKDDFEWQFMLDLSLNHTDVLLADVKQTDLLDYLELGLLLDISYKGFFLQTNSRRSSTIIGGGEFGYQITVQKDWQLDLIIKAYIEGYDPAEIIEDQEHDIPQLAGLSKRNPTGGIALRYTHFFEQAVFYIDFATARALANDQRGNATCLTTF